ncbi:hypothetical protein IAU60_006106 [Kwoniella sp. DSM 27419]
MANQPVSPGSSSEPSSSLPPRTSLLQNLSTQSILLTQLFSLVAAPSQGTPAPQTTGAIEQIYAALQLSTLDLSSLVKEAHEHQAEWKRLQEQKAEVEMLEKRVRGLVQSLEHGRKELEGMVDKGRQVRSDIDRSERNPIPVRKLLTQASALARHSSAPVSSLLAPVDKAQYQPWPTEMAMRQGLLFQLEGSMGGMGERGVMGDTNNGMSAGRVTAYVPLRGTAPARYTHADSAGLGTGESAASVQEQSPQPVIIHHEEPGRRFDPNAVFDLALNSDESDED